jgi:hypothetical protein
MKKLTFILVVLALTLQSCISMHGGNLTSSASLQSNNFNYVKRGVQGESNVVTVIVFTLKDKKAIVEDAKKDLLMRNPLSGNQTLANVVVDFKSTYILGVVIARKCVVTADIVEFK